MGMVRHSGAQMTLDGNISRRILAAAIVLLSLYVFPAPLSTFTHLNRTFYGVVSTLGDTGVLQEVQRPLNGEYVVPEEVLVMVGLLRKNGITTFRLSPAIAENGLFTQRLAEVAYPIRYDKQARHLLAYG